MAAVIKERLREVDLRGRGAETSRDFRVWIPAAGGIPDIVSFRHKLYVYRGGTTYAEASMWPVVDELDHVTVLR